MSFQRVHEAEDAEAVAETDEALLCTFPDRDKAWVPKSQIDELSDLHAKGDRGILTVSRWFAEKVGWV